MEIRTILRLHSVPHYYGDNVRMLLLLSAIVSVVAIPLVGNLLPFGIMPQVGVALLLVLLAGLTNPHGRIVMLCNAIVSGVGLLMLESVVISLYPNVTAGLFIVSEAVCLMLLFAFYYSVKTLRAFSLGKLGKWEQPQEFADPLDQ